MTLYTTRKAPDGSTVEEPERVIETRLTGFGVHAGVLASSLALPLLSVVPLPVVSGVFLHLGRRVVAGNLFVERCKKLWLEKGTLDPRVDGAEREMVALGRWAVFRFTAVQVPLRPAQNTGHTYTRADRSIPPPLPVGRLPARAPRSPVQPVDGSRLPLGDRRADARARQARAPDVFAPRAAAARHCYWGQPLGCHYVRFDASFAFR